MTIITGQPVREKANVLSVSDTVRHVDTITGFVRLGKLQEAIDYIRSLGFIPELAGMPDSAMPPFVKEIIRCRIERTKQVEKFGQQDHTSEKWLRILMEEVGEAAKEMNEHEENTLSADSITRREYLERLRAEVNQIATVAIAWNEKLTARIQSLS